MGLRAHLVGRLPLSSPWPPPLMGSRAGCLLLGVETLRGRSPLPPYIYLRFGLPYTHEKVSFWCCPTPLPPPPLPRCLAKPCGIATLLHHHHAVVLLLDGVFPNLSLSPCWIKAWETSPGCTCVERGGTVLRCLDRNQPRSESLRVRLPHPRSCNASASRSTRVCRCTPLPLVARLLHRLILVMRRKF